MLALPHRRQHSIQQQHHSSSTATPASTTQPSNTLLPSPLSPQTFSLDALSQQLSAQQAQQFVDQKLLNDYLESQQTTFNPQLALDPSASNPFMSASYDFTNPQIRVQQSTPIPQHTAAFSASPMLSTHVATTATGLDDWSTNSYNAGLQDSQTLQTPQQSRSERTHQRAPSSSSIGSAGYQYVAYSEASPLDSARPVRVDSSPSPMPMLNALADPSSRTFSNVTSNHLPTPTPTPTQDSFMNNSNSNNFNTYTPQTSNMDSTMAAHMSMKQALMDQHVPDDDVPGFAHSARHSVSSYNGHDSPATPHTTQGDDADFKLPPNGETLQKVDSWLFNQFITYEDEADVRPVPKFERTYTDVAADYSYDPNNLVVQAASIPNNKANALLSPYRSSNHNELIQRSLQAAQMARSQSPSSSASRGDSPFRRGSPYRQPSNNSFSSPRVAVGTAAAAREQKLAADAAHAMKSQVTPSEDSQVKTISPKDALLDYRDADEDSKVPLFPDGGASDYSQQFEGLERYRNTTAAQSGFDTTSQSFQRDNSWATPQFSPNFAPAVTASSLPSSTYAFASPPLQRNTVQNLSSNATSQYRNVSQMNFAPDQNPEFPAHLTSMESSCSEAGGDPSSQSSDRAAHTLAKPVDSKADSGTYTCTYHGCTQRFETPQKLQKHKREGHRNTANLGMGPTSSAGGMTSAALLERNSQAGPHKCERINPTTGKPCNTIFSRPYDLTRHEDTIHNVRKQKVRCALCVEEKTFSRNDALTRHMRVVHPEVDFPGKHRRRGGAHD